MKIRVAFAVILNLLAIAVPGVGLLVVYGQDTTVRASNPEHALAILLAVFVAFSLSVFASVILRREGRSELSLWFVELLSGESSHRE